MLVDYAVHVYVCNVHVCQFVSVFSKNELRR